MTTLGATTRTTRIVAGLSVWRGTHRVRLLSSLDDLRKISIHFVRMSQMGRDVSAIVVIMHTTTTF